MASVDAPVEVRWGAPAMLDGVPLVRPPDDSLPVGCIATSMRWQATVNTLTAMRSVVHALRAWPAPMGAAINTADRVFDEAGAVIDPHVAVQLETVGRQVVEFALLRCRGTDPGQHVVERETQTLEATARNV